ncbi:YegP family protein [Flavobacterium sp. DG1-102-2]|uniref:YegP family protein n=1 Tax=Flavobacterium sp. DG1-102-2 TaxID=3081663 RepID=UPI00294992E4|nr:YegP family protein [Flavobacterium sp. DG1-102-2]MDV6168165.1 YegP family protein [Flavobacterium sp. DG1-102-2]
MGKFTIKKRSDGEFQFDLKAGNGQGILTSEGYTTKASCMGGIDSVRKNSQIDSRFEKKTASNGKYYFTLKAMNGLIIGQSEMYEGKTSRDNGIESVKFNAATADVEDKSE